jgi:ketosteroid isomerase-like protein
MNWTDYAGARITFADVSRRAWLGAVAWLAAALPVGVFAADATDSAQQQVFAAERAFARSMADRNREAFATHVSDEAIFFGTEQPLRGKAAVVAGWSSFFDGVVAPFSWEPDQVEVLPSGTLALSTGLVRDAQGKVIARFNSIWRLEAPGTWRVVFDKGSPPGPKDVPPATATGSQP